MFEGKDRQGVYLGLEWSNCRINVLPLSSGASSTVRDGRQHHRSLGESAPGETCEIRPGFLRLIAAILTRRATACGAGRCGTVCPTFLRQDPSYPKVQWNAFARHGKAPGSWEPLEKKYYPLIDDIAPLGFEEVMIDVGWWQGPEPQSHSVNWPAGMRHAADVCPPEGHAVRALLDRRLGHGQRRRRRQRADRITRLFREYHADLWRSDSTGGPVIGYNFASTRGFYDMVDQLAKTVPGFQWENCSGGGRIKDYGAMQRAVKIFGSDTYSTLNVRQVFYDASFAFLPMQMEGHLINPDARGAAGMKYAFRSMSMGAPEWFLDAPNGGNGSPPWTQLEKRCGEGVRRNLQGQASALGAREPICTTFFPVPTDGTGTALSIMTRLPAKVRSTSSSHPRSPPRRRSD